MELKSKMLILAIWFIFLCIWELSRPFSRQLANKKIRWPTNIGIIALGQLTVKLLIFFGALKLYTDFYPQNLGFFKHISLPEQLMLPLQVIFLDFLVYWQHRLSHVVPMLWRLHRVHHLEDHLDVTSAIRFHPLEIAFSFFYKLFFLCILGISFKAFAITEFILTFMAMFNHANIKIPNFIDKILRLVLVTPNFHRVHHVPTLKHTNSNYGFNLSVWDYFFKSYENLAADDSLMIGKSGTGEQVENPHAFGWLLLSPFHSRDKK